MNYDVAIQDMLNGEELEGFYILKDASLKTTANGKSYLSASLSDCTGVIDAKVWDYTGPIGPNDIGKIIKIRATVGEYRGNPQLTIDRIRLTAEDDKFDLAALVPCAPINAEKMMDTLRSVVDSIGDPDYRAICDKMLAKYGDKFAEIPAAKSVHHSFLHGLLMHTFNMLSIATALALQYGDTVNRDLLLTGTLLHDFGKIKEFDFSEYGLVTDYSTVGQLMGHLVIGAQEVNDVCRELGVPEQKSMLLQHMILSHHGEPEFGAAVRPLCLEAELLYLIDMLDSRVEIFREAMQDIPVGTFSNRIFALDRKIYNHKGE